MIRIATAGYQHESNTFSAIPASLDLWRRSGILEDAQAIRAELGDSLMKQPKGSGTREPGK